MERWILEKKSALPDTKEDLGYEPAGTNRLMSTPGQVRGPAAITSLGDRDKSTFEI